MFINLFTTLVQARIYEFDDSNWTIGQTVYTSSGPVEGHAAQGAPKVSEYLGIPYAKAPVGNLRFAAPQPYHGTSTINGTNFVSSPRHCKKPQKETIATAIILCLR